MVVTLTTLILWHSSVAQNIVTQSSIKYDNSVQSDRYLDMTVRCMQSHVHSLNVKKQSITATAAKLQVQWHETHLQLQMPELYIFPHSWTTKLVKCKQQLTPGQQGLYINITTMLIIHSEIFVNLAPWCHGL